MEGYQKKLDIQFFSDIHLESKGRYGDWWKNVIVPEAPYLVLAGDICPVRYPELPRFYEWCVDNFKCVIHVPGNHEYWGDIHTKYTIEETENYMENLCNKYGVVFAQKDIIELEKGFPKLVCCTLWSKLPRKNIKSNDFTMIEDLNYYTRSDIYYDHVNFIKNSINSELTPPIVVTHHAPLIIGTQRNEHVGNPNTLSYTNDLGHLADLCTGWIFGHTHHVCDIYRESGCVVTSNPIGHIKENLPYDKSAVLSVEII